MGIKMLDLDRLIVCSACHSELPLGEMGERGECICSECGRRYTLREDVYNMIPLPLPDGDSKSQWSLWEQLQQNGLISYSVAPELNLSVGIREDAAAFKDFCALSGLILDVGCGPQSRPSYLPQAGEVVGVDPLVGHGPREFAFVQAIGEYLPFRDGLFDHVLFATSLDHMMDPRKCLKEAKRLLRADGSIDLWLDSEEGSRGGEETSWMERSALLAKKALRTLSRWQSVKRLGFRRVASYIEQVARMKVPAGALDYFHFEQISESTLSDWLKELGLVTVRQEHFRPFHSLFIQVQKDPRVS